LIYRHCFSSKIELGRRLEAGKYFYSYCNLIVTEELSKKNMDIDESNH